MHLVFDFDGTITTKDTISELFHIGIEFQKEQRGEDMAGVCKGLTQTYLSEYDHYSKASPVAEANRDEKDEIAFLRGLKQVEEASLIRVGKSGIFRGLDSHSFFNAGVEAIKNGRVTIRPGFQDLLQSASAHGHRTSIISVNWSKSFINGVLHPARADNTIANEVLPGGLIGGPPGLKGRLTTSADKKQALLNLARPSEPALYFGDSATDLECLLQGGIVMAADQTSKLISVLQRLGHSTAHVNEVRPGPGTISWAQDFAQVQASEVRGF